MNYRHELPKVATNLMKRLCTNHVQKNVNYFHWLSGISCSNTEETYVIMFNVLLNMITVMYFGKNDESVCIHYSLANKLSYVDMLSDIKSAVDSFSQPIPFVLTGLHTSQKELVVIDKTKN